MGLKPAASFREDLADALADEGAAGSFTPEERAMLANILRLREVRVDDVMVPRADIDAVDINVSLGDLLAAFRESGHSRMPVYRETLDDPVGMVHIKDLMIHVASVAAVTPDETKKRRKRYPANLDLRKVDLAKSLSATELVRTTLFVPPSMPVAALLASMQATRVQMALVIDEYGGTDGLVSLEDVVEIIVGDIEDEHDDDDGPMIVPDGEGAFLADARADLDEVAGAVGVELGSGEAGEDVDTIGGLVYSLLGRIPVRGELVAVPGGFEIEILEADPRRIKRLRIYRHTPGSPRPEPRRRPKPQLEPDPEA
ncbi:MAG: hemolysin family protein [Bauldia sp.]